MTIPYDSDIPGSPPGLCLGVASQGRGGGEKQPGSSRDISLDLNTWIGANVSIQGESC